MHDANLEERLRSVLRSEGDNVSLTITTDELERRLVLRRRARTGQRLSLMAAGIAIVAVGSMVALSNGWLGDSNVATDPSPSPAPTAPSTVAPSASPHPDNAAAAAALAALPTIEADPRTVDHYGAEYGGEPSNPDTTLSSRQLDGVRLDALEAQVRVVCRGADATLDWGIGSDPRSIASETITCDGTVQAFRYDLAAHEPLSEQTFDFKTTPATAFRLFIDTFGSKARLADPLGDAGQAVLVTPIGNAQRPERFEITTYDPATSESRPFATVLGSVIPTDAAMDSLSPQISATGWLALKVQIPVGPEEADQPGIVIVDTRAPEEEPWILDGYGGMSWDQTDRLIVTKGDEVFVAWPTSRFLQPFSVQDRANVAFNGIGFGNGPAVTAQDGARFLATGLDEPQAWGYLGFDGVFTPTNDLPPVYARSGLERPAGAAAHGLSVGCDSGVDAASSGCYLVETNDRHEPVETWVHVEDTRLHDFAWASDGASAWLLLEAAPGSKQMDLVYAASPDDRTGGARIKGIREGVQYSARLLGITGEATAGQAGAVVIGNADGSVHAIVREGGSVAEFDGTAWFAGWAADPAPYDPD
jgi:hypothetical protein